MKRALLLLLAAALPGCSFMTVSLPRGVYLHDCTYGELPGSQPARCMTRSEYRAAKEKARQPPESTSGDTSRPTDPRYKDWIP